MKSQIPTPQNVGLPESIDRWRPQQEEALNVMITSKRRFKTLCAPTGSGKSAIAVADALLSKVPTCIVTDSRGLQDQYLSIYKETGMVDLRGRSNYDCQSNPDPEYTCEDGYASRCPYKGTVACPSSQAEMRAAISNLVITNYDKWIAARRWGNGMQHFQKVIFDEAHSCPDALARAMQVYVSVHEIINTLDYHLPDDPSTDDIPTWKEWACGARDLAEIAFIVAQERIKNVSNPRISWVRQFTHMRNLLRRLSTIATANPKDWVVEPDGNKGFQFDPIRPGKYAESNLFFKTPQVTFMSATILPKTMYMLGVAKESFSFLEFDSDFDPKRCPIHWIPTMRVDVHAEDLSPLWLKLDQIIARRKDRKGIVHTISYTRRDQVMAYSRFADKMMFNPRGDPPTAMVEVFKRSKGGSILVSPSIHTGYDFPDDDCRWQFVCKVPFPPPSKIGKARQAADKEYAAYQAVQYLVQAFGRGMRHKGDACVSPDTKVLTGDLRWIPAGNLRPGDKLLTVSEHGEGFTYTNRTNPRRWRWTEVEAVAHVQDLRLRVILEDGEMVCTVLHPWLVSNKVHRTAEWVEARKLQGARVLRMLNTWSDLNSHDAGWLAGFTDGEGCLITQSGKRNPNVSGLWIAQNEGAALDKVESVLTSLGFNYLKKTNKPCRLLQIKGGYSELLRYLGSVRPVRLLANYNKSERRERALAISYPKVLAVESIGRGPIVRIKTTEHTYLTEGYASHNCENFVPDNHFGEWFLPKHRHLFPKWFHNFFKRSEIVPPPLNL